MNDDNTLIERLAHLDRLCEEGAAVLATMTKLLEDTNARRLEVAEEIARRRRESKRLFDAFPLHISADLASANRESRTVLACLKARDMVGLPVLLIDPELRPLTKEGVMAAAEKMMRETPPGVRIGETITGRAPAVDTPDPACVCCGEPSFHGMYEGRPCCRKCYVTGRMADFIEAESRKPPG